MSRRFTWIIAVALLVAACGGSTPGASTGPAASTGGGGGGGGGAPGTQAELEAAARAQFEAFKADDDDAYFASLSDACRASAGFGTVSERNNSRHGAIKRAGIDLAAVTVDGVAITGFDGQNGTVALQLGGTGGNEFLESNRNSWIHEGGTWHWANCDPFKAGGGGNGDVGGSGPEDAIQRGLPVSIADWLVYTTYIQQQGNDLVKEGGNPDPPAGTQYFLWQVSVTYDGPDASANLADDLGFRLVAGSTTYDSASDCGAHPGALDLTMTAAPGDGQMGDVCHAVASGDVAGLHLVITDKASGTDYWFAQQ